VRRVRRLTLVCPDFLLYSSCDCVRRQPPFAGGGEKNRITDIERAGPFEIGTPLGHEYMPIGSIRNLHPFAGLECPGSDAPEMRN
jgi:hypothetical protein